MNEENKRKSLFLLMVGTLSLLIVIVGATYAFFQAQTGDGAKTDATFITDTTDNLTFIVGGNISINANLNNFGKDKGENQASESTATANLIANSTTNLSEEYRYNIYLEVDKNDFEYVSYKKTANVEIGEDTLKFMTKYEKTLGNNDDYRGVTNGYEGIPELFLTIISPEGTEYTTAINGLGKHYTEEFAKSETETDTKVGGYDITELREGIYPLIEDKTIQVTDDDKAQGEKTDEWKIRVTLKYLADTDQQLNAGKAFEGKIIIQSKKIPTDLMDVCTSGSVLSECIKKLHDDSKYGASNLILHDGQQDYEGETNYLLEAGDESYRYTGSFEKVNNYVCLGTNCSTDPTNDNYHNLYRIIGTFKNEAGEYETKVVKADYANKEQLGNGTEDVGGSNVGSYDIRYALQKNEGSNEEKDAFTHRYRGKLDHVDKYLWQKIGDESTLADWPTSLLNKNHLNTEFYNKIEDSYKSLIENHNWVYASDTADWVNVVIAQNVKVAYDNELGDASKDTQKKDLENIGLLYVSDYLYGASPKNWTKKPLNVWTYGYDTGIFDIFKNPIGTFPVGEIDTDYRSATDANWLYLGLWDWLITQRNDVNTLMFRVYAAGIISAYGTWTDACSVRPTFYLNNNAKIKSGTGTIDDPYTLLVEE